MLITKKKWFDLVLITKKKKIRPSVNYQEKKELVKCIFLTELKEKIIESEMSDRYLDLARDQNKVWDMRVIVIPIVAGALGTVSKNLEKSVEELKIRGRIGTIQTTALLGTARIVRRVLETIGNLAPLRLEWKTTKSL